MTKTPGSAAFLDGIGLFVLGAFVLLIGGVLLGFMLLLIGWTLFYRLGTLSLLFINTELYEIAGN